MLECVAGESGVINLYIYLEIFIQTMLLKESYHCLSVDVILMLGGLHRFRFDKEGAFDTLCTCIVTRHGKHTRNGKKH